MPSARRQVRKAVKEILQKENEMRIRKLKKAVRSKLPDLDGLDALFETEIAKNDYSRDERKIKLAQGDPDATQPYEPEPPTAAPAPAPAAAATAVIVAPAAAAPATAVLAAPAPAASAEPVPSTKAHLQNLHSCMQVTNDVVGKLATMIRTQQSSGTASESLMLLSSLLGGWSVTLATIAGDVAQRGKRRRRAATAGAATAPKRARPADP